jgi:hypothetical protein
VKETIVAIEPALRSMLHAGLKNAACMICAPHHELKAERSAFQTPAVSRRVDEELFRMVIWIRRGTMVTALAALITAAGPRLRSLSV